MKSILEYLENDCKYNGEKIAVIEENKRCTYLELEENSKKIGTYLTKYEIINEPVAVLMEKGITAL